MTSAVCIDTLFSELQAHEKLSFVAEAGIPSIEFWGWRDKNITALAQAARAHGLTVSNFSAHRRGSPVKREEHAIVLADITEAVNAAETLECGTLMILSNELGDGGRVTDSFSELAVEEKHSAMCELLTRALALVPEHIRLVIEPLNTCLDHAGNYLSTMNQAMRIVDSVGSPRCTVLADLYHLGMMGEDLDWVVQHCTRYIGYVHIADIPGRGEPGTGEIDWLRLLSRLRGAGYQGTVGFEYMPQQDDVASLAAVKALIDEVQTTRAAP